jgi:hypothetical protein
MTEGGARRVDHDTGIALGAATSGAYTAFTNAPDYSLRIHGAG